MRFLLLFALLTSICTTSKAQLKPSFQSAYTDSLALDMDFMRNKTEKRAMTVLGTWSILNLSSSLVLSQKTSGIEKQFHTMNGLWNIVNGGLALSGFMQSRKAQLSSDAVDAMNKYHKLERTLIFNAGLDLAYMATGLYLEERGKHELNLKRSEQLQGFGKSLMLQGGFLLVFDAIFYSSLRYQSSYFKNLMQIVWLRNGSAGINIHF
jgi:hypothetical protein